MNKNCLVIGGTSGIGKATCDLLSLSAWDCIAVGREHCDMHITEKVDAYLKSFPANVSLDAIVFSHGEWFSKPRAEHTILDYYRQYHSRVLMPIRVINYFSDQLKASPVGSVVVVSSTRGFIGGVDTAPYSMACAAQIAMVSGMAREYEGIRFNCLCPGLTNTPLGSEVVKTGGAKIGARMLDPKVAAREIVELIENVDKNGVVMRTVARADMNEGAAISEAKWTW